MQYRSVLSIGTLAVATAVVCSLGPVAAGPRFENESSDGGQATPAAATAQKAAPATAKPWTMPRTVDGKPDLQGTWSNATLTPLERLPGQGLILTDAQTAQIENRTKEVAAFRDAPSDPNRPPPVKGGEDRPLPPGEPTFIERISASAGGKVGGYNNFWLDPGERVLRIDGKPRGAMVIDPPDGRVPALTPEARTRAMQRAAGTKAFGEFDHPELRGLAERCLLSFGSNAGPPMVPNYFYNNNYQIVQTKDHVMIMTEMVHDARIIRMGAGLEHPPKSVRQWLGDSIGRWDGDTLVVETTNFHPQQQYRGASENLKITERFTRAGPDQILYRFTVEDPTTFVAPWTAELAFNRTEEMIYEYACHEGNYALSNVLSGERSKEKRDAEKMKKPQ
ncbi:MAG TPA: hypothetical protein VNJ02_16465 [Vicinamibacterales bacterium]|nr:hypothetical protein [Vicinamibacterales bacterium]